MYILLKTLEVQWLKTILLIQKTPGSNLISDTRYHGRYFLTFFIHSGQLNKASLTWNRLCRFPLNLYHFTTFMMLYCSCLLGQIMSLNYGLQRAYSKYRR
jgi:hypothetical protein